MNNRLEAMWASLEDEEYRRAYAEDVGTGLAFQIRMLREKHGWTQEQLAALTGKKQATISQWENPDYGNYTLSTLKSLAAAFDVALVVKYAPFSELVDWNVNLTPARLAPSSFTEERTAMMGKTLAALSIPLGAHDVWETTSGGVPNFASDSPSLSSFAFPPHGSTLASAVPPEVFITTTTSAVPIQSGEKELSLAA